MGRFAEGAEGIFGKKVKAFLNKENPAGRSQQGFPVLSLLRLIFLQQWKEKLKIWNSRNRGIFVFTFVSS
jgi:hypothetical protein